MTNGKKLSIGGSNATKKRSKDIQLYKLKTLDICTSSIVLCTLKFAQNVEISVFGQDQCVLQDSVLKIVSFY